MRVWRFVLRSEKLSIESSQSAVLTDRSGLLSLTPPWGRQRAAARPPASRAGHYRTHHGVTADLLLHGVRTTQLSITSVNGTNIAPPQWTERCCERWRREGEASSRSVCETSGPNWCPL